LSKRLNYDLEDDLAKDPPEEPEEPIGGADAAGNGQPSPTVRSEMPEPGRLNSAGPRGERKNGEVEDEFDDFDDEDFDDDFDDDFEEEDDFDESTFNDSGSLSGDSASFEGDLFDDDEDGEESESEMEEDEE